MFHRTGLAGLGAQPDCLHQLLPSGLWFLRGCHSLAIQWPTGYHMRYCMTLTHRPPLSGINSGWGALGLLSRIVLYLQTNRIVVTQLLSRSSPHYNGTVYRRHCNSITIKFLVIFFRHKQSYSGCHPPSPFFCLFISLFYHSHHPLSTSFGFQLLYFVRHLLHWTLSH